MKERICYFCEYRAPHNTIHEGHLRKHTKEKPFSCILINCFLSFALQSDLIRHYKKVHKIFESKKRQRIPSNCYFCSRDFGGFENLNQHMLSHTRERPYKCVHPSCKKFTGDVGSRKNHALMCSFNPNVNNNIQTRDEIYRKVLSECQFQCYFCSKIYKEKSSLYKHIQRHTGELKVSCFGCKIQFNYRDIWKHKKVCVISRQLFMCPFCNAPKTSRGELNNHIRNVHTKDDAKTKCYFCNISFPKDTIRGHLVTHTKEKAFKCGFCILSFTQHTNLKNHIASKHRDTEQGKEIWKNLRRECYFCKKYFSSFENLRKHMALNTMEIRKG